MQFSEYAFTHVGLVRQANEDSYKFGQTPNGSVYVVCDGMGGHVGGAIASQTAVNAVMEYFSRQVYENVSQAIDKSIQFANEQIFARIQAEPELHGMGTTAVVLVIRENECYIGHVGDSRIYLRTGGRLERITKDHSFVQTLVDSGAITEEEAEMHPQKNQILRALGHKQDVEVTLPQAPIRVKSGDTFLLCSDGLTGMVGDPDLHAMLEEQSLNLIGDNMLNAALANGGVDNITGIIIHVVQSPHQRAEFVNPHGNALMRVSAQPPMPDFSKTDTHGSVGQPSRPASVAVKRGLSPMVRIVILGVSLILAGFLVWFFLRDKERPVDVNQATFSIQEVEAWPENSRKNLNKKVIRDIQSGRIEIQSDWANEDGKKTFAVVENGVVVRLEEVSPERPEPVILPTEEPKEEEKKPESEPRPKGKTVGEGDLCMKPNKNQGAQGLWNKMKEEAERANCEPDQDYFNANIAIIPLLDSETTYCVPCNQKEKEKVIEKPCEEQFPSANGWITEEQLKTDCTDCLVQGKIDREKVGKTYETGRCNVGGVKLFYKKKSN